MTALIPFGVNGDLLALCLDTHDECAGETCLCEWSPPWWQVGCPTTGLPPAPIWTSALSTSERNTR